MLRLLSAVSLAAFLTSLTAASFAAIPSDIGVTPSDQVVRYGDQRFACSGVGVSARENPAWGKFPLKMVFTNANGAYLGDVAVDLTDSSGNTVVAAHCHGPWLLADLRPGKYTAMLDVPGGHEKSVKFNVTGKRQTEVIVPFKDVIDD